MKQARLTEVWVSAGAEFRLKFAFKNRSTGKDVSKLHFLFTLQCRILTRSGLYRLWVSLCSSTQESIENNLLASISTIFGCKLEYWNLRIFYRSSSPRTGSPSWAISLGRKDRAARENTCFASLALLAEFLTPYFLPHKLQHKLATLFDDTLRYFVCPCFQI